VDANYNLSYPESKAWKEKNKDFGNVYNSVWRNNNVKKMRS
jgi:hypothetical protein